MSETSAAPAATTTPARKKREISETTRITSADEAFRELAKPIRDRVLDALRSEDAAAFGDFVDDIHGTLERLETIAGQRAALTPEGRARLLRVLGSE